MKRRHQAHQCVRKSKLEPNFSGQHLLVCKKLVRALIDLAEIGPQHTVLDIGAGKGALTFALADAAGKVIAIENDPSLAEILRRPAAKYGNIVVREQDIRTVRLPQRPFTVVSSIPYAITTPIMTQLLASASLQQAVLVMEKGAAIRFASGPVRDVRQLIWRMWYSFRVVRTVPSTCFSPPPSVDSAVLHIVRRSRPLVSMQHRGRFAAMADLLLRAPQLPVREALRVIFTPRQISIMLRALGCDHNMRINAMTLEMWAVVFQTMIERVDPVRWPGRRSRR